MSTVRKAKLSPQEYLALERQALTKSEYYNGEVFAFAGASESHHLIVSNVLTLFNTQLKTRSPSTERDDRIVKFAHYRRLPSVKEFILIAQDSVRLEQYVRQGDGRWLLSEHSDLEVTAEIQSIGCELPMRDVYDKVVF